MQPPRDGDVKDRLGIDRYPAGMDLPLETRELRYFLAVAEELHFGRAASRLGIAQPPLSRAIRQLEARLGVQLLERTSRQVTLTAAGAVLAAEARPALDAVAAAGRRAQRAGVPRPRLALALTADGDGGLLPELLAAFAGGDAADRGTDAGARGVEWPEPELLLGGWGEQVRMLRDGRADVALLHAPFDAAGIDSEPLMSEPRVVALAASHRLARRRRLTVADVAGEPLPRWEGEGGDELAPLWCGRHPEAGRGRRPGFASPAPRPGPPAADVAQLLTLVGLGRAVAFVPETIARRSPRPDVAYRPVADLTPLTLVVAWPERSRSLATAAFVRTAAAVAARRDVPPDGLLAALAG
jgi:DNA-binding transcriptional LysR family regulator